ncbi:hypothetical protein OIO90_003577 [Microbotryomycetes sp. JL221]|nr:hypothetical protein OIO90_003577 [Microbotryomycetes sp. JL221]
MPRGRPDSSGNTILSYFSPVPPPSSRQSLASAPATSSPAVRASTNASATRNRHQPALPKAAASSSKATASITASKRTPELSRSRSSIAPGPAEASENPCTSSEGLNSLRATKSAAAVLVSTARSTTPQSSPPSTAAVTPTQQSTTPSALPPVSTVVAAAAWPGPPLPGHQAASTKDEPLQAPELPQKPRDVLASAISRPYPAPPTPPSLLRRPYNEGAGFCIAHDLPSVSTSSSSSSPVKRLLGLQSEALPLSAPGPSGEPALEEEHSPSELASPERSVRQSNVVEEKLNTQAAEKFDTKRDVTPVQNGSLVQTPRKRTGTFQIDKRTPILDQVSKSPQTSGTNSRTRAGLQAFSRDVSSSPLSSLPPSPSPSPQKTSRMTCAMERTTQSQSMSPSQRKPHSFSLIVPVRVRETPSVTRPQASTRRLNLAPLLSDSEDDENTTRVGTENGDVKMEDDSPTVAGTKRSRASTTNPHNIRTSKSSDDGGSDDSESDDGLTAMLRRAKERRAAGEALAAPEAPAAPDASVSATGTSAAVEQRKSSRNVRPTGQEDPSSKMQPISRAETAMQKIINGLSSQQRGKYSIESLRRERARGEVSGKAAAWQEAKRLISADSDDEESDASAAEENDEQERKLTSNHLDDLLKVAENVVDDHDDEYAAYAGSPQKRNMKSKAEQRAAIIADALKSDMAMKHGLSSSKSERKMWKDRVAVRDWQEDAKASLSPWRQTLERAINAMLWSRLHAGFKNYRGDDAAVGARRCLSFALHSATHEDVASRALAVLDRMLRCASAVPGGTQLVRLADLREVLHDLGARQDVTLYKGKCSDREPLPAADVVFLSHETRQALLARLLSVITSVAATEMHHWSANDVASLCSILLHCALEPASISLHKQTQDVLAQVMDRHVFATDDGANVRAVFIELIERFGSTTSIIRSNVLLALPIGSSRASMFRRQLALGLLESVCGTGQALEALNLNNLAHVQRLCRLLKDSNEYGLLVVKANTDDTALYNDALVLTMAVSELGNTLKNPDGVAVDELVVALERKQDKIRADVRSGDPMRQRAKIVLTRVLHSLIYQRRTAQGIKASDLIGDLQQRSEQSRTDRFKADTSGLLTNQATLQGLWAARGNDKPTQ